MHEQRPNWRRTRPAFCAALAVLLLALLPACDQGGSSGSSKRSSSGSERLKRENSELRREIGERDQKLEGKNRSMVTLAMFLTAGCAVLFLVGASMGSKARTDHDRQHSRNES